MRFVQLVHAASVGLLQQIPIMGPVIEAILVEQAQAASEQKLAELIRELSQSRSSPLEQRVPNLVPALLLAEAEVEHRLERNANPQGRFLYLAADRYANLERTYEIVVRYGFLWRSYHNVREAAIGNVRSIRRGDLIALAYRVPMNRFRVLLPLVVTESSPFTKAIDIERFGNRYLPFVWANSELSDVLRADYEPDPVFKKFTGLPVKPLYADLQSPEALGVLQGEFRSPGNGAIWPHDYASRATEVPAPVRDWIARL